MPTLREHWRLGKWLIGNAIGGMINLQSSTWLVFYFIGTAEVAVVGVAAAFAALPAPLLRSLEAYLLPRMSHTTARINNTRELRRLMHKSLMLLAIPYSAWLCIALFLGDQLVTLLYGDGYGGHGALIGLLVLSSVIWSLSTPLSTALHALERADITAMSVGASATVTLLSGMALIPTFGLTGAGMTAVLAAVGGMLYKWIAFARLMRRADAHKSGGK
jgi:O-antigen/teichoic acid export membrane protein